MFSPRIERPPEGLARGLLPTSGWVVLVVAAVVVLVALGFFALGLVRRRRRT